jgi:hypothetical protein
MMTDATPKIIFANHAERKGGIDPERPRDMEKAWTIQ